MTEHPTYKRIQEYIEEKYGFKVHSAYIAEIKRMYGLDMHKAPNAVEKRKYEPRPCPAEGVKISGHERVEQLIKVLRGDDLPAALDGQLRQAVLSKQGANFL